MKSINYKAFYDLLVPRLFEVATYQTLMRGKVENVGKQAQSDVLQSEIHGALTYLDQFTQDYLLIPIFQRWPDLIPLAEEDTGLKRAKLNNQGDYALILDPIDGTAFYLRGERDYSIMLGLMHKGKMKLGLICYPEKDQVIAAIKGQGAWVHSKDGGINALSGINTVEQQSANIACHYRFTEKPYDAVSSKLSQAGYTLASNGEGFGTNASGILRIAKRESCAFIGPHMSLHDFSVPAFIIQELGGVVRLYDYNSPNDLLSWSALLPDYGCPDPKGPNPRYRVIIADSETTIRNIIANLTN